MTRTGTPLASATSASIDEKTSGRAMARRATQTAPAMATAAQARPASSPRMEPNNTLTPAVLLPVARDEVNTERKSTPTPRIHANTAPMVTSSARPTSPSAPSTRATATVAAKIPRRASRPAARATRAPVKATWLRASPANT